MFKPRTIAVLAFTLAAASADAATITVRMLAGRIFSPATVDIRAGDTILWRNDDTMDHTATSGSGQTPDGRFNSGNMPAGATFSYTFASPGSFDYFCEYHSGMTGKVVVHPASSAVVQMLAGRVFSPLSVTVQPGDTVIWRNDDTMDHTSTSGPNEIPDGLWASGNMAAGATFARVFPLAGSFDYFCEYHSGMTGSVIVATVPPPSITIKAARAGGDVELTWSGGSAPWDLLRGSLRNLSDLAVFKTATAASERDLGAVANPPALVYYQVQ